MLRGSITGALQIRDLQPGETEWRLHMALDSGTIAANLPDDLRQEHFISCFRDKEDSGLNELWTSGYKLEVDRAKLWEDSRREIMKANPADLLRCRHILQPCLSSASTKRCWLCYK